LNDVHLCMNKYFVYSHHKEDGTPFYIGLGKVLEKPDYKGEIGIYSRAFQRVKRTESWVNIAYNCNYTITIVKTNLTKEEGLKLENELILKYGKIIDGSGTLVNLYSPFANQSISQDITLKINQLDLNGNLVKVWKNPKEIEVHTKYLRTNIVKCCRKKQITAYGFKWEYAEINQFNDLIPTSSRKNPNKTDYKRLSSSKKRNRDRYKMTELKWGSVYLIKYTILND
jgi:hypothetical protein